MKHSIASLRVNRGLSQVDLAKELGITQKTVSYWEVHPEKLGNIQLLALAKFFNVEPEDIRTEAINRE